LVVIQNLLKKMLYCVFTFETSSNLIGVEYLESSDEKRML